MYRTARPRQTIVFAFALGLLCLALGPRPSAAINDAACIVDGVLFDTCSDSGLFFPDNGPGGGGIQTQLPDLTSLGGFFFQPLSLEAGDSYSAQVVLYNLGGLGFNTTFIEVGLYLSPLGEDALLPTNQLALLDVSFPHVSSQFPHPTYVVIPIEGVLPASVAPGQYRLAVDIDPGEAMDELDELNNKVTGGEVIAVGGDPDLQPVPGSLDPLGTVDQGATLNLRSKLRNVGKARIDGPVSIAVRYRAVPDEGDELGQTLGTQHVNLGAGQSIGDESIVVPTLSVPASLLPGSYQIATDVDFESSVAERDETNNSGFVGPLPVRTASPAGRPDLAVSDDRFKLERNPLHVGDSVLLKAAVQNLGSVVTPGSTFDVKVYASADANITTADHLLEVVFDDHLNAVSAVPALAAGAERKISIGLLWPPPTELTPGTWHLGLIANPTPAFDEPTFANNALDLGQIRTVSVCDHYATAADAVAMWDLFFTGSGNVPLDNGTVAHFAGQEYCEAGNTLTSDADYFGFTSLALPDDSCNFVAIYVRYANFVTHLIRGVMHSECVVTFDDVEARPEDNVFLVSHLENRVKAFKADLKDAKKQCDLAAASDRRLALQRRYCSCSNHDYLGFVTFPPHPGDPDCRYAP